MLYQKANKQKTKCGMVLTQARCQERHRGKEPTSVQGAETLSISIWREPVIPWDYEIIAFFSL